MDKNELLLDRVRSVVYSDLDTNEMLFRLTSVEDPTLTCTAEGEEITDAIGSVITTLYRAKKASFSATNSLISLDLAAAQYGTAKNVATNAAKISTPTYEILEASAGKLTLSKTPNADIKFIYGIDNGEVGTHYESASTAGTDSFVHEAGSTEITLGSALTGKFYVEYTYDAESAVEIKNKASNFPGVGKLAIYCYFKDKCNENKVYSGIVLCPKAKINPEQIELALTSTGKHSFEMTMMKDYCDEVNDELFSIIVAE